MWFRKLHEHLTQEKNEAKARREKWVQETHIRVLNELKKSENACTRSVQTALDAINEKMPNFYLAARRVHPENFSSVHNRYGVFFVVRLYSKAVEKGRVVDYDRFDRSSSIEVTPYPYLNAVHVSMDYTVMLKTTDRLRQEIVVGMQSVDKKEMNKFVARK